MTIVLHFSYVFHPSKSSKRIVCLYVTIALSDENVHASYQLNINSNLSVADQCH